ncbi:MAG: glycosyltransferase family 39 protein, partial [Rhodospirillaceae bacterium]
MFAQSVSPGDGPDPTDRTFIKTSILAVLAILAAVVLIRVVLLMVAGTNLFPEEAALWLRGRMPDFGTPDGPFFVPMVLGLADRLLGEGLFVRDVITGVDGFNDEEAALRIPGTVAAAFACWLLFRLGQALVNVRVALWAALLLTLPLVSYISAIACVEPFVLAFWGWGMVALERALATNRLGHWLQCGLAWGFGMLSSYVAVLFLPCLVLFTLLSREHRGVWRRAGIWLGLAMAAVLIAPHLLWNAQNEWSALLGALAPLLGEAGSGVGSGAGAGTGWALAALLGILLLALGPVPLITPLVTLIAKSFARTGARLESSADAEGAQATALARGLAGLRTDGRGRGYPVKFLGCFFLPVLIAAIAWTVVTGEIDLVLLTPAAAPGALLTAMALTRTTGGRTVMRATLVLHVVGAVLFFNLESGARVAGFRPAPSLDPFLSVRGMDTAGDWAAALSQRYPGALLAFDDPEVMRVLQFYIVPHPLDARLVRSEADLQQAEALLQD